MLEKTQSATSMLSLQELRETFQGKSFTREELQVLCPRGDEEYGQFIQTLLTFLETNPNTLQTVPSLLMEYLPDDQTYRFVFAS